MFVPVAGPAPAGTGRMFVPVAVTGRMFVPVLRVMLRMLEDTMTRNASTPASSYPGIPGAGGLNTALRTSLGVRSSMPRKVA